MMDDAIRGEDQRPASGSAAVLLFIVMALVMTACGSGGVATTGEAAPGTTVTGGAAVEAAAGTPTDAASTTGAGAVPVMPNLSEADVEAVTAAAAAAYEKSFGDGSGAEVVWGPNIIYDWALIGMENFSGQAGKDVLLYREGGQWVVKDMGQDLSAKWNEKTPAGLWPSM